MNRDSYTDKTAPKWAEPAEGPGLVVSPHVWIYGVLCLAIWAALCLIFWGRA